MHKDSPDQRYAILIHKDGWRGYKSVGPFANYDVAHRWLNDHISDRLDLTKYLFRVIPITPSSKVETLS